MQINEGWGNSIRLQADNGESYGFLSGNEGDGCD